MFVFLDTKERSTKEKFVMLHRKIYQICSEGREVSVFLRDQQRWIEDAKIIDLEGDVVTIRYETEDEEEISAWEEIVRLESIGTITQKIASVSRTASEIPIAEDCPEAEKLSRVEEFPEKGETRPNTPDIASDFPSGENRSGENRPGQIHPNSPDTNE